MMFKILSKLASRNNVKFNHILNIRTFISDSYKCTEEWNARLKSPLLQKLRIDELYFHMDQKFQHQEPVSAIDIDVFVNALQDDHYVNELRDTLYKFRMTPETINMLDSTSYAVIRYLMDNKKYDELVTILDDRLNYGIFADDITGNMLLDDFIKMNDFTSAAKVASFFMLQEDFEGELTEKLSLYACFKYLTTLQPEIVVEEKPVEQQGKKKKEEEIKVRVRFLRNPFFDDHFDIQDLKLLSGKTLAQISSKYTDPLFINLKLIGYLYYKKIDKVQETTEHILKNKILLKDTVSVFKDCLQHPYMKETPEIFEKINIVLTKLEQSVCMENSKNIEDTIKLKITELLNNCQEEHIQRHKQLFSNWDIQRVERFKEQVKQIEENKMEEEKLAREKTLRDIEEKIWFFDNEEVVDLKIERKKIPETPIQFTNKKTKKSINEVYIPPEVQQRRST